MTKREHVPLDFDPKLERRQPPPLGCVKIFVVFLAAVCALVFTGLGVSAHLANQAVPLPTAAALPSLTPTLELTDEQTPEASPTPLPSATPDAWSATGTALALATVSLTPTASPTLDYCYWLTPTDTPTATLPYTPDAWQATGTAVWEATHPYKSPTPAPPRELCIEYAALLVLPEATAEVTGELIFVTQTPSPTTTPFLVGRTVEGTPEAAPVTSQRSNVTITGGRNVEVVVTSAPQIVVQTAAPPPPQIIVQTQVIVATPAPLTPTVTRDANWYASATAYYSTIDAMLRITLTAMAPTSPTPTASATDEPGATDEPETTLEASITPSETATASPTPTASETPTEPPTATTTATPTPTLEPTQTPEPTVTDVPTEPPTAAPTDGPPAEESSEDA